MSIFTPKSKSKPEPKASVTAVGQGPMPQSAPLDGAFGRAGAYHYARGPLQRRAMATPGTGAAEAGRSGPRPMGGMRSAGLPVNLQSGIQALSGLSLDDVKVHYNSFKPAQLNAHAYAQGDEIHLAPGQERHLAHEAWHVVQQREGRARATGRIGGQPLNDDAGLEREADHMGSRAARLTLPDGAALRQRSLSPPSNPPVQGYFLDSSRRRDIFNFEVATGGDIAAVRGYLADEAPGLLDEFNAAAGDQTNHGALQAWLKSKGLPVIELIRFPQTRNIPLPWIVSTSTPNDGGPTILLEPGYIGSPNSSQDEDIGMDGEPQATDLVIDLTQEELPYHRGGTIPTNADTRSEVRASAMLTNEYVDYSTTPLIGRGTAPIKDQTKKLRDRARDHDKQRSKGRTYSHHPDTFWTGQSFSAMGWHPVGKHTNTLDGDYQQLTSRGGQRLTGVVTKEKSGYKRPSLTSHSKAQDRQIEVDALMEEIDGADLEKLTSIHASAEEYAVTGKARNLWRALGDVLSTLPVVIADGEGEDLAERAAYFLAIEFDQLPESTSSVAGLFYAIADALKELKITAEDDGSVEL